MEILVIFKVIACLLPNITPIMKIILTIMLLFCIGALIWTTFFIKKESKIKGGIFDSGASDVFIHQMPIGTMSAESKQALKETLLNWQRKVRSNYYDE